MQKTRVLAVEKVKVHVGRDGDAETVASTEASEGSESTTQFQRKPLVLAGPPCEDARMRQRIKQVAIGKLTEGYTNYVQAVPKGCRDPSTHLDTPPTTPRSNRELSKREFESILRNWRKYLHHYDSEPYPTRGEGAVNGEVEGDREVEAEVEADSNRCTDDAGGDAWQVGRLPTPLFPWTACDVEGMAPWRAYDFMVHPHPPYPLCPPHGFYPVMDVWGEEDVLQHMDMPLPPPLVAASITFQGDADDDVVEENEEEDETSSLAATLPLSEPATDESTCALPNKELGPYSCPTMPAGGRHASLPVLSFPCDPDSCPASSDDDETDYRVVPPSQRCRFNNGTSFPAEDPSFTTGTPLTDYEAVAAAIIAVN